MRRLAYRWILSPARTAYYKAFRPEVHGVQVIIEDERSGEILMVRHSYGDRRLWHLPGGGYRPHRETPEQAARREIREELSLQLGALTHLGEHRTSQHGERNTVQVFRTTVRDGEVHTGVEIAEHRWMSRRTILESVRSAGVTERSLSLMDRQ